MENFIKIQDKNLFLLSAELLGLPEARLWIGRPDGPADDEDVEVAARRMEDKRTNPVLGIEAMNLGESEKFPGWFEMDTANWPAGDGKEWIANWPKIKKETEKHMQEKIIQTKNPKGIVGLIALLGVVILAALWMAYLMRHNWFGTPNITGNPSVSENSSAQKDVPAQLDDLRVQMKDIADKKDKEINDALK